MGSRACSHRVNRLSEGNRRSVERSGRRCVDWLRACQPIPLEQKWMNPHDQKLLNFARRWEPFGGPEAADLLIEFGMTPSRFAERLKELGWRRRRSIPGR